MTYARTRELRLTALRVLIAMVFATFVAGGVAFAQRLNTDPAYIMITVRSGESLWSIASAYSENEADPRDVVDTIVSDNALSTRVIVPGERLRIRRFP